MKSIFVFRNVEQPAPEFKISQQQIIYPLDVWIVRCDHPECTIEITWNCCEHTMNLQFVVPIISFVGAVAGNIDHVPSAQSSYERIASYSSLAVENILQDNL